MKKIGSASLEARLKNSKDLVSFIKEYSLYSPSSDELKQTNYETFVSEVNDSVTAFKDSTAHLLRAGTKVNEVFDKVVSSSKFVRAEIFESRGKDTDEYRQVNNIVKLITGENVKEHAEKRREILKKLKEGENPPEFISVSELDKKSMLGNFRSLTALIRTFGFYNPADTNIASPALDTLEAEAAAALSESADKETIFLTERSKLINYFDSKGGLKDRARRAKSHVKRKYGTASPEYVALTKKVY